MKNFTSFQLVLMGIFLALAVFGVLVFAGAIKIGEDKKESKIVGKALIWGSVDQRYVKSALDNFNKKNRNFSVTYVQKDSENLEIDFLKSIASGRSPDILLLTNDNIFNYQDRINKITYEQYPLYSLQTSFFPSAEVFAVKDGILAFPLMVDPIVMYYNQKFLFSNDISSPPKTWEDLSSMVSVLTQKDSERKILRSAIALGQFSNINNAKEILISMFMQTGNKIIEMKSSGSFVSAFLGNSNSTNIQSLASVLSFYTSFGNPTHELYSWNRSFSSSKEIFSFEKSAFYLGFGSEIKSLIDQNPNQSFLVSEIPQISNSNYKSTYAKSYGLAIPKSSKNFNSAFSVANLMSNGEFARELSLSLNMIPARKDLFKSDPQNVFLPVFYSSALFARSWLDPSYKQSSEVFRFMIDNVLSNSFSLESAIRDAGGRINFLLVK